MIRSILHRLADSTMMDSAAARFRRERFRIILEQIQVTEREPCSILDVGGEEAFWAVQGFDTRAHRVCIMNNRTLELRDTNITFVHGDALHLEQWNDRSVDLLVSNSVIEHVGMFPEQQRMAAEVLRVARHYHIQTPNHLFPLEPHFLFPFFHWLPVPVRAVLHTLLPLGWYGRAKRYSEALRTVRSVRLLRYSELRRLFPDGVILRERFGWFTKSFIVIDPRSAEIMNVHGPEGRL